MNPPISPAIRGTPTAPGSPERARFQFQQEVAITQISSRPVLFTVPFSVIVSVSPNARTLSNVFAFITGLEVLKIAAICRLSLPRGAPSVPLFYCNSRKETPPAASAGNPACPEEGRLCANARLLDI